MRRPIAAAALCLLMLLGACGGGDTPSGSPAARSPRGTGRAATSTATQPATATAVDPDEAPAVSITSPDDGATVEGSSVKVKVDVDRLEIVDKIGKKNKDGEGHLFFYLDTEEIPTTPGRRAARKGEGKFKASASTSHTWKDVPAGSHKLGVQIVHNNSRPLQPPVTAEITITVEG